MGNDIILLGICVVILILIIFFYIKDRGSDKKFERFDLIITENMQEIFLLKKEIAELKKGDKDEISKQISDEIENKIAPVLMSLKSVDSLMKKNLALNSNEKEIILAYKNGKSIEEISKEYGLENSIVEFILKFNKIL
ncbi:MAG: hypothetical protein MR902_08325 [Campylobacter sp.]|nr:hypothetical protein [Campylobacter sp.]